MRKLWLAPMLLAVPSVVRAQMPDFSIVTDIRAGLHFSDSDMRPRMYDPFGRISTVTLSLLFDGFYRLSLSERFTRIPGDTSSNLLEHLYLELPGVWRLGQIDPKFGRGWLIREHGLGGEFTTHLLIDNLPITISAVDNGGQQVRAISARVGGKVGVSFATGKNVAASGTSLVAVRRPEKAPGVGRGYQTVFGMDASSTWHGVRGQFEYVGLRNGSNSLDVPEDILDFELSYQRDTDSTQYRLGYARTLQGRSDHLRGEVEVPVDLKLSLTGQYRLDAGRSLIALGLHLKF